MVFAGFFLSRLTPLPTKVVVIPAVVFVTGNFDVSGATLVYMDQLVVTPTDVEFKTDGTKLFVSLQGSSSIYEYSLSTAWDLTTIASSATTSLSVSNVTQVNSIDFNRTGTKLYLGCSQYSIAEFTLSTPYDISTAGTQTTVYTSSATVPSLVIELGSNGAVGEVTTNTSGSAISGNLTETIKISPTTDTINGSSVNILTQIENSRVTLREGGTTSIYTTGITLKSVSDITSTDYTDGGDNFVLGFCEKDHNDMVYIQPGVDRTIQLWHRVNSSHTSTKKAESTSYILKNQDWNTIILTRNSALITYNVYVDGVLVLNYTFDTAPVGSATDGLEFINDDQGTDGFWEVYKMYAWDQELTADQVYTLSDIKVPSNLLNVAPYSETPVNMLCFSNSVSNNYITVSGSNKLTTIEIDSDLSNVTVLGTSANVVPLISNVIAPDIHTTRTLEVSGDGTRFYQIYRNTNLSNVYVVEFKPGTPHDASTLTSSTQIEDYYDLSEQSDITFDTVDSLKIKPDGSEMFLYGSNVSTNSNVVNTYYLNIPSPFLYISGDQDDVYDILSSSSDVTATGTGVFTQDTSIVKVGTGSLDFNGSTSMILSTHVPEFVNTTSLTLTAWIRPDIITTTTNGRNTIFASNTYHSTSGIGFALYTHGGKGGSVAYLELFSEYQETTYVGYAWNTNISNTTWVSGLWRHVAIVLQGNNLPKCYLDGEELSGSFTLGSTWYFNGVDSGGRPQFGVAGTLTSTYYDGKLDNIKFFNTVLPEKSIKKMYLDGLAPPKAQAFHLTFEDNTEADILSSGVSLGGTSLATLQSTTVTYQGDYVGDYTSSSAVTTLSNWTAFDHPFTVSFWMYYTGDTAATNKTIVGLAGWSSDGFRVRLNASTLYFYYNTSEISFAITNFVNSWHHVSITSDGTIHRLFFDGDLKTSTSSTVSYTSGQTMYIGAETDSTPTEVFTGYLDDIRIYDYVLDPKEIEYLYTSTVVHTGQSFYLSYDQSNVYDYYNGSSDVAATGTGVYYQNPGSKIGTHSGEYPQDTTATVIPTWSDFITATALTVSLWVFPKSPITGTQYLFASSSYDSTNGTIAAQYRNTSGNLDIRITTYNSGYKHYYVTLGAAANYENKWMHLVFVYTSSGGYIYINGVSQTLTTISGWNFNIPSGDDLVIGNYTEGGSTYSLNAALDDFRVFTRELNAQEIAGFYRQYTQSRIYTVSAN